MDVRNPIPSNGGDLLARLGELWKNQAEALQAKFGGKIEEIRMPGAYPTDVPIIFVKRESVIEVLRFLRDDPAFEYSFLADLTATDEESDPRFEVIYNLFAMARKARIRVKTRVPENDTVPTATPLWPGANWAEREVYDMFGIKFSGHPDMRRILMDKRFQGHPLRKDYPLRGYQIFPTPEPIDESLLEKDGVT